MKNNNTKSFRLNSVLVKLMAVTLILVMIGIGTFAWFTLQTSNDVNSTEVIVTGDDTFEISLDGVNYSNERIIVTQNDTYKAANKDLRLLDITGDGITFTRPELDSQIPPGINYGGTWKNDVTKGKDYISFDIYFRSKNERSILLASGSNIETYCELQDLELTGEDCGNRSSDGAYSRDCIVGALRTAFCTYTTYSATPNTGVPDTIKLFWIPRPDIYFNSATNTVVTNRTNTDPTTAIHKYYNTGATNASQIQERQNQNLIAGSTATGTVTTLNSTGADGSTNANSAVAGSTASYYISKVRINIWVEGTDAEARRAFSGGKFRINFNFVSSLIV